MRLAQSSAFRRRVKKLTPSERQAVAAALRRFAADPFDAALRSHKLSGELAGKWAFSAGYDLRVVFTLEGDLATLLAVGSHDEVC